MPRRLHGSGFWKRRARLQLMHHPLCTICLAKGVVTPATVADHVEPHHGNPNSFYLGKLQSLCTACHSGRKQSIEKLGYDKTVGSDGWPIDPRHPVYQTE
jgi:5-methylcytosine-specific restriction endonuclease McrA